MSVRDLGWLLIGISVGYGVPLWCSIGIEFRKRQQEQRK
jgi:hypothetical protein